MRARQDCNRLTKSHRCPRRRSKAGQRLRSSPLGLPEGQVAQLRPQPGHGHVCPYTRKRELFEWAPQPWIEPWVAASFGRRGRYGNKRANVWF